MKEKQTNPHIQQRILKLIRTCVSEYPESAPEPDDLKVVALFDFVESCRDKVDITLFISGLATMEMLFHASPIFIFMQCGMVLKILSST